MIFVFKNRRIKAKLRAQLYLQTTVSVVLSGCETWALKDTHKKLLSRFHHDCARSIYGITRWHHQHKGIKMETVLNDLSLDRLEQILNARTLRFLERIASLEDDPLLRRIACSQAEKNGKLGQGSKPRTTQQTWARTLQESGLIPEDDNGARMKVWAEKFRNREAGPIISRNLKIQYEQKSKKRTQTSRVCPPPDYIRTT